MTTTGRHAEPPSGPVTKSPIQEEDIDGLAAEYVRGTLDAAERQQVNIRRHTDVSLSAAIDAWERRLGPLNDRGHDVEPQAHLLDGVLSRISSQVALRAGDADVGHTPRLHWRVWAGASAVAASLVLAIAWSVIEHPAPLEHSKLNCGKIYKDFWQKRDPQTYGRLSSEQLAGVSRMALRAYDACQAGDEQDAKALLARLLERSGNPKSPTAPSLPG
jgi:hypothetical protein